MTEIRRGWSSTSVNVNIQNPSKDSLPNSFSTNPSQITEEPFVVDSASVHSSPDSLVVDQYHDDEPLPGFPTSSNTDTLDYSVPEGRFVRLINSDEILRYTKDVTMQVGYIILSLYPYMSFQTPHGDSLRGETFNNHIPPVRFNFE
jgi:hypothetical protein